MRDGYSILANDKYTDSRKMRESIEIYKHETIDQEGKLLNSTWCALFNKHSRIVMRTREKKDHER